MDSGLQWTVFSSPVALLENTGFLAARLSLPHFPHSDEARVAGVKILFSVLVTLVLCREREQGREGSFHLRPSGPGHRPYLFLVVSLVTDCG